MSYLECYKYEETPPLSPSQRVYIIDMPDLVMRKILEEVDLVSIMILRKVCRAFRNYIDDTKPDSKLNGLAIYVRSDSIRVSYEYFLSKPLRSEMVTIRYKNKRIGFDIFCEDMQRVLGNQKTPFSQFLIFNPEYESNIKEAPSLNFFQKSLERVCCRRTPKNTETYPSQYENSIAMHTKVFDCILETLKSRKHPLQVSSLYISVNGQDRLETLMEHVESRELTYLTINDPRKENHATVKCELNLDVLKNFGNLKGLKVHYSLITSSLETLSHILIIEGTFKKITATDIIAKIETHLKSTPYFRDHLIKYDEFPDESRLFELFGTPFDQSSGRAKWKFNFPKSEGKLVVTLTPAWVEFYNSC